MKKHHWFRNVGSRLTNRMAAFLLGERAGRACMTVPGEPQSVVREMVVHEPLQHLLSEGGPKA